MANRHRGEIDARLNGTNYRLCLTLGALAELEHAFGDADMVALAERHRPRRKLLRGRLRAQDCVQIIGAGLRGAGTDVTDEAVSHMQCDSGIHGFVEIVASLLQATFGTAMQNLHHQFPAIQPPRARRSARPRSLSLG